MLKVLDIFCLMSIIENVKTFLHFKRDLTLYRRYKPMKKMDEMDRNIQLRSEEWGYKSALLALGAWTLFNCWQTLKNGAAYNPLPGIILCFSVCIQGFFQFAMKRKMIAGDDEYKEPNKFLWAIIGTIIVTAIILSIGTYIMMKA